MVEQATENRCVGGSIPPVRTIMKYFNNISVALILLPIQGCKSEKIISSIDIDIKWMYCKIILHIKMRNFKKNNDYKRKKQTK